MYYIKQMSERFLFVDTKNETDGEFTQFMNVVAQQNENRKNWTEHDTPEIVAEFITEEAQELIDAINQDKPAIEIASEIGDVLYLTLRLCAQLGIDPRDALEMKIVRNSLKYSDTLNSNGDYQNGANRSRELYDELGGDLTFYDAYSELVNNISEE